MPTHEQLRPVPARPQPRSVRPPGVATTSLHHARPGELVLQPWHLALEPRSPKQTLRLQRTIGNHAVVRLLGLAPGTVVQRQPTLPTDTTATGLHPPPKTARPSPERIAALRAWLTAHVAGHPLAVNTYTFYEVIDQYLGPWGATGYPLAYGKRYNVLFTSNATLMADPVAQAWVWRTTIILQEALITFIVSRFADGTLGTLTEAELREAAFDSHPMAYTAGGLARLAAVAPTLIPVIASIPRTEFSPTSPNFRASLTQVASTATMVVPQTLGILMAAAFPAHTGMYRIAIERDQQAFMAQLRLSQYLADLRQAIEGGRLDNINTLEQITQQLYAREFPDQGFARAARELIELANRRKIQLARQYDEAIRQHPELGSVYDQTQPGWRSWLSR